MGVDCGFELESAGLQVSSRATVDALRLVLLAGIDREVAAAAMGFGAADAVARWPSGVYAALARTATTSPVVWHRCKTLLDATFGDVSDRFGAKPASEVAQFISEGRSVLSVFEIAAMLWSLLRRSQATLDRVIARLGGELEVVAFAPASRTPRVLEPATIVEPAREVLIPQGSTLHLECAQVAAALSRK